MFIVLGKISCREEITKGLVAPYKVNSPRIKRVTTNTGLYEVNKSKTYPK